MWKQSIRSFPVDDVRCVYCKDVMLRCVFISSDRNVESWTFQLIRRWGCFPFSVHLSPAVTRTLPSLSIVTLLGTRHFCKFALQVWLCRFPTANRFLMSFQNWIFRGNQWRRKMLKTRVLNKILNKLPNCLWHKRAHFQRLFPLVFAKPKNQQRCRNCSPIHTSLSLEG